MTKQDQFSKEFNNLELFFNSNYNIQDNQDIISGGPFQEKLEIQFELADHKQKTGYKQITFTNQRMILSDKKIQMIHIHDSVNSVNVKQSYIPQDFMDNLKSESRFMDMFGSSGGELVLDFISLSNYSKFELKLSSNYRKARDNQQFTNLKFYKFKINAALTEVQVQKLNMLLANYKSVILRDIDSIPLNKQRIEGLGGLNKIKDNMKVKEAQVTANISKDAALDDLIKMKDNVKESLKELKNKQKTLESNEILEEVMVADLELGVNEELDSILTKMLTEEFFQRNKQVISELMLYSYVNRLCKGTLQNSTILRKSIDNLIKKGTTFRILFDANRLRQLVSNKVYKDDFIANILQKGQSQLEKGTFDIFQLQDCFNLNIFSAKQVIDKMVDEGKLLVDNTQFKTFQYHNILLN